MEWQSHVEHCATIKKIWVDLHGWSWHDPRQQSKLQNRTWRTSVYVSGSDEICVFLTWSDSICYKGERITLFVWKWKETTTERLHCDWPASVDQIDPSLPRGPCLAWPPYWGACTPRRTGWALGEWVRFAAWMCSFHYPKTTEKGILTV